MPTITLIDRQGRHRVMAAEIGQSLLSAIRSAGCLDPPAVCGGARSCGSCHIHVAHASVTGYQGPTREELELLEGSRLRTPGSRLACHVLCTAAFEGMIVAIPPEE